MADRLLSVFPDGLVPAVSKRALAICALIAFAAFCFPEKSAFADEAADALMQPASLNYAGIYSLSRLDPGLTGRGVNIALICRSITYIDAGPQNDYRPDIRHNCLQAAAMSFYDRADAPQPPSAHSTAIASILFGTDPNAFHPALGWFRYRGVAPEAGASVYEFWHFITENVFSSTVPEAEVLTMSIGNQFEDWWTRGIESMAERRGLVVVAGIGNGSCVYDPVLYPAAGANVIGVGVVESVNSVDFATGLANFWLPRPEHSSCGPTQDSRCKPDIVAAGNCLAADVNDPSGYEPTGDWSSFSAPVVAGTAALLVQKAKQDPHLSPAISPPGGNCVIKAILLNSARKLAFWHKGALTKADDHEVPLDYAQGAGVLDAAGAYEHLTAGQAGPGDVPVSGWDKNRLAGRGGGREKIYRIKVSPDPNRFITATLVWNKHFADAYPFKALGEMDADLRLELWALETNDPQREHLLDYSDSRVDNVEHIYYQADPNYTDYEIVVSLSNSDDPNNMDKDELYALAWNLAKAGPQESILWYDLNADGVVNGLDLTVLLKNFSDSALAGQLVGTASQDHSLGDINMDGLIDIADLQLLAAQTTLKADWYQSETQPE
jgi:hypothetical protein